MSSPNEQIQPTAFDVAPPTPEASAADAAPTPSGTPNWVLPALGGLALLALLVVFWLPSTVSPPQAPAPAGEAAPPEAAPTAKAGPKSEPTPEASPWSEAQLAKLRKEAQDVLAELLDVQFGLQERGVEQWAGDALYKERDFVAAKTRYEEALNGLLALEVALPEALEQQLELARQGLEAGDPGAVEAALELATLIDPGSGELAQLQQRAERLPELLALLEQAGAAEAGGDLATAEQHLRSATELDPDHQHSADELARVAAAHLAQRFNDAMSDGYAALDDNRFAPARKAFRRAAGITPGSAEAASALLEVDAAETAHRLASLRNSGRKHEGAERWKDAVADYRKALDIDANVLFAREGMARAEPRARLDALLRKTLDTPSRLADPAVAEDTATLLQQAQRLSPKGPLLEQQLAQVSELLEKANTPIQVTLRSDTETEVIVYKVARLGRFDQRALTLRPGTYTAVGTRNGYRDVRHTFTVSHDDAPPSPVIVCREQI